MIIVVDRAGDVVVQKVVKPDGSLVRYQYGKPGDSSSIIHVNTLEEARQAIGKGRK
jgi:hypothetical protein